MLSVELPGLFRVAKQVGLISGEEDMSSRSLIWKYWVSFTEYANLNYLQHAGLIFVLSLCLTAAASATNLYIAPDGSDNWSGTRPSPNAQRSDGPLATLTGARDAIRKLKETESLGPGPVYVNIGGGNYFVNQPLDLTWQDSGSSESSIVYRASDTGRPVFSGARAISGWKDLDRGLWRAQLPPDLATWRFEQLWVNGRRAVPARSPNKFYYYALRQANPADDITHGDPSTVRLRAFGADPKDIAQLAGLTPAELHDVVVVAFHSWETARLHIKAVDLKTGTIIVSGKTEWGFFNFFPQQRFYLEGFKSALDAPGEWFLDRNGGVFYRPLPGETIKNTSIVAPAGIERFIDITGDTATGGIVHDIQFRGLAFEHSQYVLPEEGHSDGQAEFTIPAVIMADDANDITFDDCEIAHIGTYAVWFRHACKRCTVTHCYLHDLGAGGVRIGEDSDQADVANQTDHNVVDNCIIQQGCRIHTGAIGVWIGQSADNQVTHNDIGDFYYTGISVGWRWGYAPSIAKRNIIRFNHIHHIGEDVLGDLGAVYTLGPSEGTVVSDNTIHDVYDFANGGSGLYNDEGSTGILMENNLVYNVSWGYHQNYGRDDTLHNNIFANASHWILHQSTSTPPVSITVKGNIEYGTGAQILNGQFQDDAKLSGNLYWSKGGSDGLFVGKSFGDWQATGRDSGSLFVDPQFFDANKGDFRLRPGSPAAQIGFQPFDYTAAGVYGDRKWIDLARSVPMPARAVPPPPPAPLPVEIRDGFEFTAVGDPPLDAHVNVEGKGDSITVTSDAAAAGQHSLKIVTVPGLNHSYDPHMYYTPNHTSGVTTLSFDLMIEPGTNMYDEWRDSAQPYRSGPHLEIRDGSILAGGKALMTIPHSQWVHFEIIAGLGASSTGTWDLSIAAPGEPVQRFTALPNVNGDWKKLDWLGFANLSAGSQVYYLDNVRISNTGAEPKM
jgi:hypothetical protein